MGQGETRVFNHFRDKPQGLMGVTGGAAWPVGAGWHPLGGGEGVSGLLDGCGGERSTVWVEGASAVVGARWPSSPTSIASSLSEELSDNSLSEGGGASG